MDLVTQQEKDLLEARLAALVANRPAVSLRIAEARALGDLKENGDYHAARETQGLEEAEIRRLSDRLARVSVVDDSHRTTDVVSLGSMVRLCEVGSHDLEVFKMVGEATGTMADDYIEVTATSPMGEALMKSRKDDVVGVRTPRGLKKFKIVEIM